MKVKKIAVSLPTDIVSIVDEISKEKGGLQKRIYFHDFAGKNRGGKETEA